MAFDSLSEKLQNVFNIYNGIKEGNKTILPSIRTVKQISIDKLESYEPGRFEEYPIRNYFKIEFIIICIVSRNRFEFQNIIGRGGFGKVWLVKLKGIQSFKKNCNSEEANKLEFCSIKSFKTCLLLSFKIFS